MVAASPVLLTALALAAGPLPFPGFSGHPPERFPVPQGGFKSLPV